jgi:hypothetical protein
MRKNIRVLNIFCEAVSANVDCGDKAALEGVISNINQKIKDAATELKSKIRSAIEGMPAPQQQSFVQRFWNRINPPANSQLGVLGQIHEELKTNNDLYYDILILEALFNKEIARRIFNESAKPQEARIFSIINKSVDDFFNQFTQSVDNSISVMLNNRATPEQAKKAINNLNHIGAATDQDANELEEKLKNFIKGAVIEVRRSAEKNIQSDRGGTPLSFIKRGWNWLTGRRITNTENDIQGKEQNYITNQLKNNPATAGIPDNEITAAVNHLNNLYRTTGYNKSGDFDSQLDNYESSLTTPISDRNLLKTIHVLKNKLNQDKERYGSHLGGLSEAASVEMLKDYNKKGHNFLTDAIVQSSKEVIEKLLNDVDFKTQILSVVKCLQLKVKGLHTGPVAPNNLGNDKWLGAVDEFYYNRGHDLDQSTVDNIRQWMDKFNDKIPLISGKPQLKIHFPQAIRRLDVPDQLTINRLAPEFKHVLNIGYNILYNLPPPQPKEPVTQPVSNPSPKPKP